MSNYPFQQLINGRWVNAHSGRTWDLINPATEEIIQKVPFGGAEDAQEAIDAAAAAFKNWSRLTPYERYPILMRAADWITNQAAELAKITTEESGKPYGESLAEWRSAANYVVWAAEEGKRIYGRTIPARVGSRRIQVSYHPLGVVGTITAWNFPVYNIIRTWSSALAAGCTVVGRPSEYTPRSGMLIAQAFHEAGVPAGVVNLINGDPETMGQVMLQDYRCRKISFTGSTRVGKILMQGASQTVTQLALELGGNAPLLIFPSVGDLKALAQKSVEWKFRNCGQVCVSPQRFYVHSQLIEPYLDYVVQFTQAQKLGNGLDQHTTIGPLINNRQRDRLEKMVQESVAQGAQLSTGGQRPTHLPQGYFYEPTVLTNVYPGMPIYDEEIFGPVLPVIPFNDVEEVLTLANQTEYGLAAFVHTQDLNTALLVSERLEYGMVCVNDWLPATPEAPFGGVKQSGLGRESGSEGLFEYLEEKTTFFGGVI